MNLSILMDNQFVKRAKKKKAVNATPKFNRVQKKFRKKQQIIDVEKDAQSNETAPDDSDLPKKKKPYISAYKRAEMEYRRIQEQKRLEAEERRIEMEQRRIATENYESLKKKMNKALMCKTKKGQPKLDAQIGVLLEKIEKRVKR